MVNQTASPLFLEKTNTYAATKWKYNKRLFE